MREIPLEEKEVSGGKTAGDDTNDVIRTWKLNPRGKILFFKTYSKEKILDFRVLREKKDKIFVYFLYYR